MTQKTTNQDYPLMPNDSVQLWKIYNDAIGLVDDDIGNVISFLKLDPNILAFGVGEDPGPWEMTDGATVPLVSAGTTGNNPPTIVSNQIIINSPGLYDITAQFGIDIISGNNTALVDMRINGTPKGITAGVEFSGGQAAPINQPTARDIAILAAGDVIDFVVTELGTAAKLLYWNISGGSCAQIQFDFDALNPPATTGVFLFTRFLPVEIENMGRLIKGEKWQPGPPPSDDQTTKMVFFLAYMRRFPIQVTDPFLVAYVNEMEAVGLIAPGRAAVILSP